MLLLAFLFILGRLNASYAQSYIHYKCTDILI